jgi:hypothetical protein
VPSQPFAAEFPVPQNNREIYREFFGHGAKTSKFCPKAAHFTGEQGINRELSGISKIPCKPAATLDLAAFSKRFKERTGN